jgi:hypothetical protein
LHAGPHAHAGGEAGTRHGRTSTVATLLQALPHAHHGLCLRELPVALHV